MIAVNRELIMAHPELMAEARKEAKATLDLIGYCENLMRLRKYEDWERFDWGFMCTWANKVDEPFVKLMLSLAKHGYKYGAISMHKWWRRLKAVGQQHLITFFTYQGFNHDKKETLWWETLYEHCCRSHEVFVQMASVFNDDKNVEMNLRALLGISQARDIKEAWHEWAKQNHPDKGGSVDKFIIVKAAYEEWQYAQQ